MCCTPCLKIMVSMLIMTSTCSFYNTGNDHYICTPAIHIVYEILLLAVYPSFTLKNLCHCYRANLALDQYVAEPFSIDATGSAGWIDS